MRVFRLHAFRNDLQVVVMRDGRDPFDQPGIARRQLRDELAIDVRVVEWKARQHVEIAVMRAEVIDRLVHDLERVALERVAYG